MIDLIGQTENLTQTDIEKGIRNDCKNCPVARVVRRLIPNAKSVKVVNARITKVWVTDDLFPNFHFVHSSELSSWIRFFDKQRSVKPVTLKVIPRENHVNHELGIVS